MTRKLSAGSWTLRDAKAHLGEVIRKAKTEGPQRITIRGREEVVIISFEEYQEMKGEPTGATIVAAFRDSPLKEIDLKPPRTRVRARPAKL